jgi:hypothetical protein
LAHNGTVRQFNREVLRTLRRVHGSYPNDGFLKRRAHQRVQGVQCLVKSLSRNPQVGGSDPIELRGEFTQMYCTVLAHTLNDRGDQSRGVVNAHISARKSLDQVSCGQRLSTKI